MNSGRKVLTFCTVSICLVMAGYKPGAKLTIIIDVRMTGVIQVLIENDKRVAFLSVLPETFWIHQAFQHAGGFSNPKCQGNNPDNTKGCRKIIILIQVENGAGRTGNNYQWQGNKGRNCFHKSTIRVCRVINYVLNEGCSGAWKDYVIQRIERK